MSSKHSGVTSRIHKSDRKATRKGARKPTVLSQPKSKTRKARRRERKQQLGQQMPEHPQSNVKNTYAPYGPSPEGYYTRTQFNSHSYDKMLKSTVDRMEQNSMVYAASLSDPFHVRDAHIPDPSPFPSTVGCSIMRYQPASIDDSVDNSTILGMSFATDITNGGTWTQAIATSASGLITWTPAEHPHQASFATHFSLLRTVSMGIRFVNIGALIERGGALYINYSATKPNSILMADLLLSDETEVYDAARLQEEGIKCVYVPLTTKTVLRGPDFMNPTGATYVDPSQSFSDNEFVDTVITIIIKGVQSQEELSIEIEQVHNWEAVPYLETEYLFDREGIVGSDDKNATARQVLGDATAVTDSTSAGDDPSPGTQIGSFVSDQVANLGKSVGNSLWKQVGSIATSALMAIPFLFAKPVDYRNHVIAVNMGLACYSPKHQEGLVGMPTDKFIEFLYSLRQMHAERKDGVINRREQVVKLIRRIPRLRPYLGARPKFCNVRRKEGKRSDTKLCVDVKSEREVKVELRKPPKKPLKPVRINTDNKDWIKVARDALGFTKDAERLTSD